MMTLEVCYAEMGADYAEVLDGLIILYNGLD